MMQLKKILVPVDFSEEAELALEWAIKLAKEETESTIYLVHVLPYVVDPTYLVGWTDDLVGLRWDQAERDLVKWQNKIPKNIPSLAFLRKGRVSEEIAHLCKEKSMDLVVMTTRDRRAISRLIQQNASEETVRKASCPVLILHLNKKTEALAVAT